MQISQSSTCVANAWVVIPSPLLCLLMQPEKHPNITEIFSLCLSVHGRIFPTAADNQDKLLIQPHSSRDV